MKRTLSVIWPLLLVAGFAFGSAHNRQALAAADTADRPPAAAVPDSVPYMRNDTLFFYDRLTVVAAGDTLRGKVFVDADRSSANRRRLQRITSLSSDENSRDYARIVQSLRMKHPGPFQHRDRQGLPGTWLPLVSVRGRLYIDYLNFYPVHLTDSLFVEHSQDGPWPSVYTRFETPEAGHIRFASNSSYPPEKERSFDFYLLDSLRGIALLAEHLPDSRTHYRLLATEENSANFDLLVWEFTEIPDGDEVARDTLDYRRMIAKHYSVQP